MSILLGSLIPIMIFLLSILIRIIVVLVTLFVYPIIEVPLLVCFYLECFWLHLVALQKDLIWIACATFKDHIIEICASFARVLIRRRFKLSN